MGNRSIATTVGCSAGERTRAAVVGVRREAEVVRVDGRRRFAGRLERVRDDLCSRDMPWGVEIAYGFEELGVPSGARIVILNPLTDEPWDWG